jgi:hypothetical protein
LTIPPFADELQCPHAGIRFDLKIENSG